jgi:hypothetical protein
LVQGFGRHGIQRGKIGIDDDLTVRSQYC